MRIRGGESTTLVVDDDTLIRWALGRRLEREGHRVLEARNGSETLELVERPLDCVLLDRCLPDADGLELLTRVRERQPSTPVILMTAHSTVQSAVDAIQGGAFDFVAKPFDINDVLATVRRALAQGRAHAKAIVAADRPYASPFSSLVGESPAMREVRSVLGRYARSPGTTVLITGESGTGKDVAANALHRAGARTTGPFVNITCSALPENLLESELFGHERGAFTDAREAKRGLLEVADGGTVFLDEIGDMPLTLQAKLLRFLEDRSFRRVGGSRDLHPDVRVIAATNRDLTEAVRVGEFRRDLFYRLDILRVHMPPLRERPEDVPLLARWFLACFQRELATPVRDVSPRAMRMLEEHGWPGNVRELRNVLERAVLLADGDVLGPEDLAQMRDASGLVRTSSMLRLPATGVNLFDVERDLIAQALERTGGNQSRAATLLGLNRDQIRSRIAKFHLQDHARRTVN